MNIKCLIVDDEPDAINILKGLIIKYIPQLKVIDFAQNVDSAIEKINLHKPDLVFLDIEMPNGNGFTLFDKLWNIDFDIIFATAFDQYALKAIKYSALDYLLKPYDLRELKLAVTKFLDKKQKTIDQKRIEVLLENVGTAGVVKKIALPTQEGFIYLNLQNIIRAHADGNYTQIHLFNGSRYMISKSLGEIEELLGNDLFFRIHRSSIVNLSYVSKYTKSEGFQLFMDDGSVLDISHRRKDDFLKRMNQL